MVAYYRYLHACASVARLQLVAAASDRHVFNGNYIVVSLFVCTDDFQSISSTGRRVVNIEFSNNKK